MKQKFTLCILIVFFFSPYHPLFAGESCSVFSTAYSFQYSVRQTTPFTPPSKLISFKGSMIGKKILLQWVMDENESADQFEIEKSTDGKNFVIAALIFGTDKPETDSYEYYDQLKKEKVLYRLKIIGKNKQVAYSDILVFEIKKS